MAGRLQTAPFCGGLTAMEDWMNQRISGAAHEPFDLHLHSDRSDGADRPSAVIEAAAAAGVTLAALTDHDCTTGVREACEAGKLCGVRVLPAIEMDCEWPNEMHILGLDIDIDEPRFVSALEIARERRMVRNAEILRLLAAANCDISAHVDRGIDVMTRLHIALALVSAGYAADIRDAFRRFLRRGGIAHATAERFSPEQVIALILGAGGVPVWAHPLHYGGENPHKLAPMLRAYGVMGLEAYHPSVSEGDAERLVSIARQNGLLVTCGSDCHGAHRPEVRIGQSWRDVPCLAESRAFFEARPMRL